MPPEVEDARARERQQQWEEAAARRKAAQANAAAQAVAARKAVAARPEPPARNKEDCMREFYGLLLDKGGWRAI